MSEFGKCLLSEFLLDPDINQLNSGSYGSVPRRVAKYQRQLQDDVHRCPDIYYLGKNDQLWQESLEFVAEYLGAKHENLVFVENATFGVNAALKSIRFEPGDALLASCWTYRGLMPCCRILEKAGTEVHWLPLKTPIESKQQVIDLYEEYLNKYPNIKVVFTDHITSTTACLLPIADIIQLCHHHGKIIVVDGAHGPGQVALNLEELGADFYIGSLHKWLFSPRSCGVLYVHPKHHGTVHSPITSEGYGDGRSFKSGFLHQGTRDSTACASSAEGIRFLKDLGGLASTSAYIVDLLDKAVQLLTATWGTDKFPIPRDMEAPFMRLVRFPPMKVIDDFIEDKDTKENIDMLGARKVLRDRFKLVVNVRLIEGKPWARLSGQVFNSLEDYQALADAVMTLKSEDDQGD